MTPRRPGQVDDSPLTSRISIRFAADGTKAACLATDESGRHHAESWSLREDGPARDWSAEMKCDPNYTMVLPVDGERLLVSRHGAADTQTVSLLHRDGRLSEVGSVQGAPLRLLPAPPDAQCLALAWSADADSSPESGPDTGPDSEAVQQEATVYRVTTGTPWLRELIRVPGSVQDAATCGARVLFTLRQADGRVRVLVDTRDGSVTPTPFLDGTSHVLAATAGHVLLAQRGPEGPALLLADLAAQSVRALAPGVGFRGVAYPLALDPAGKSVAVLETVGARSELSSWDTDSGTVRQIAVPDCELVPAAAWTPAGLWLPYSDPRTPRTLAWLPPGSSRLQTPALHIPTPWSPGRVESFPGAEGPVEAVVYGPDWRTCPRVAVCLHGGPTSHWTLGFNPLFQALAAAGIAVVAPNQRGSTGYGAAHTLALVGLWGVPDLADVSALADHLREDRLPELDRPAVFGISYGGYLALLAAATRPDLWSRCAAVAPFLSGPRLHADGYAVRGMVERLDGLTEATDALGPRDVTRFAGALRARLLLVHGAHDESTPVAHSRALVRQLTGLGRSEGTDFRYLEPPDRGHAALGTAVQDPVAALVTRFLAEDEPAAPPARVLVQERR